MDDILLFLRLVLSAVFLLAGITKLIDLKGTVETVAEFGVPQSLSSAVGYAIPFAELITAGLLLFATSAWWGAVGAASLLAIFTTAIAINLARGRTPDCNCFGQVQSKPISSSTIIRNLVLMLLAATVIVQGRGNAGPSLNYWFRNLSMLEIGAVLLGLLLVAFIVFESWMLLHLFRQNGRLMLRMDALESGSSGYVMPSNQQPHVAHNMGPAVGSPAPAFELPDLDGNRFSLDDLLKDGKPLMLIFSDPGCGPCTALLPEVGRWSQTYGEKLSIALVSRGTVEENRSKIEDFGIEHVLLQDDREIASQYEAHGTPMAVVIAPNGTIASSVVGGSEAITALLESTVGLPLSMPSYNGNGNGHHHATPAMPPAAKIGDPAPEFELPDLDGRIVRLSDFKGKKTLLLFWNPGCGFCTQMLDDIKAWENQRTEGSPNLIVVSTGSVEANREHAFRSPVLLDQSFLVAPLYGSGGTPSGILVSEDVMVASEIAVGGPAVLALADSATGQLAGVKQNNA